MTILALEFSSRRRSVALVRDGSVLASCSEDFGQGTGLMLIEQALRRAGVAPKQIGLLAVALGPGSSAGVRSALSIAQGWQLGLGTQTVGVSTFEVLGESARAAQLRGEWSCAIDAQRNEVCLCRFRLDDQLANPLGAPHLVPAGSLAAEPNLFGPEATRWNPGASVVFPSAELLASLASDRTPAPAEKLEPIAYREANFVKAPPPRVY